MSEYLQLDYVALIIYALMITAWFLRTRNRSGRRSIFSIMLIVALLTNIYDIFTVLLDYSGRGAVPLKYIMNIGYLILRNLITPIYGAYIISVIDTWHRLRNRKLMQVLIWVPFSIVALLVLSSPVTHLVFYIDNMGKYIRSSYFFVLYVSAIFYLVFCAYFSIKHIRILKRDRFIPIFSIIPSQIIAVGIQFIDSNILCEMIATALCLLFIMVTIERPEEKHDASTGFLKSNAFMEMLVQANEVQKPYCVVLMNITNYSALTSYLSSSNMDTIYTAIRRRLEAVRTHLGLSTELYNLENGMFAAVLYSDQITHGPRYAQHLLDTLKHEFNVHGLSVSILPSVGVIKVPEDTTDIEEIRLLLTNFRNLKYSGEISLASSVMKNNTYSIMANMDSILRNAIENDGFEVYYQPIYSNIDNHFNSAEALIRLFTPEYGFIRPDLFIPMAEESGLIHQIGMIVFEKVCKFIASDEFKLLNLDYIEVNLSVVQCMDKNLVEKITKVCETYGVKPSQLNLEITETASSFSQKNMMSNINTLHDHGFSFSLDDFGTGYSNMVRIASLPLHIVKLDKSFTWTENNKDLKFILDNTINMVKKMNMRIVVEGVETEEMLNRFRDLGCEYIQGYFFSKPLPEYDFIRYILNNREAAKA